MQGLLEQAPPESLLTDLTLNSTALSFKPPSTSSQGVAASPIDSTQALLGKDWDNVTLPGNNSTLHGDMTFPRDSVMVTGEGEKSLISQLSINKTLDCDVTQVSSQHSIFYVPHISLRFFLIVTGNPINYWCMYILFTLIIIRAMKLTL